MSNLTQSRFGLPGWVFAIVLAVGAIACLVVARSDPRTPTAMPPLFISELGASGLADIPDEDGDQVDWIEVTNFGAKPANLAGWYLTDSFRNLARWRFPHVNLAPGQRLLVFASGKNRRDPSRLLHTNFKLNDRGEYLALVQPDGQTVAHEFLPKYPRQRGGVSFGLREGLRFDDVRRSVTAGAYTYFDQMTPGATNTGAVRGVVADLKANLAGSVVDAPVLLTLTTRSPGVQIRYTTNGSTPSETSGMIYDRPLRIAATTVLRAAAFHPGFAPSEILTRSFIFPQQVMHQTGAGFPEAWGFTNGQPVAAFYAMDRRITEGPDYQKDFLNGLRALPSISLVMDLDNLFDQTRGIYAHPMETGRAWERAASAEMIFPDGRPGFQINCGLRAQGGWNRRPEECPKHSLRLLFKKQYGNARLDFPLFGSEGSQEFETVVLRGGCNNSWLHWSGEERQRGDYIRDQWMRETAAAMGQPAARGRFVHVYLNGLYWGLYNLAERPSAPFMAGIHGGKSADYDSRNSDKGLGGDTNAWGRLFAIVNAGVTNAAIWQQVSGLLDVTNFADYMLLNYYGANADWDHASNWYAGRRRDPPGQYQFLVWDGERTLEQVTDDRMDFDDDQSPPRLFQKLKTAGEFRSLFAARVRRHCLGDGVLTPPRAADRFRKLAATLDLAIVAESARWGNYRNDFHRYKEGPYERYKRNDHWRPEIQRLLLVYFPQRTDAFLQILERQGLWSPVRRFN
ncbi:MAG: CotH kinase family protein [Verrucomicrobia bacterium]|nr:CotH kinase family protein [Verrucomicrobiota bacterium]